MAVTQPGAPGAPEWHLFVPKLFTLLRQGYSLVNFRSDFFAGLTVAIVALPLSMALAIASGTTPDKGLITAIWAGFLISMLGGSRFQIGGPTGAFVVVVFNVIQNFGYDGLVLATVMAGAMLVAAGLLRLGTWIKYMPEPVVTGFTSGIAVIIFVSQIKDLFGLEMAEIPGNFFAKLEAFWGARHTADPANMLVAAGALAIIVLIRRYAPKLPAFLIAVVAAAIATAIFSLPIDTIGSRFGGLPGTIAIPALPEVTLARLAELLPSAFTIAFLAGVESLLSAVVADGMTGARHRSNCELVAQGVANTASALLGGIPATGAIARTAANIRSGAYSPVSGMLHAVFILMFVLLLAPAADHLPLASLAAVLVIVAWNMSEAKRFRALLKGPFSDRVVLLITFALTITIDLTVAIQVGVVLASILFMHRMSEAVAIVPDGNKIIERDNDDFSPGTANGVSQRAVLPEGVEAFQLRGPLFFGVANRIGEVLERSGGAPQVFILRMSQVPLVDASGATKLQELIHQARKRGIELIISGLQPQARLVLRKMRVFHDVPHVHLVPNFAKAVAMADDLIARKHIK